MRKNGKEKVQSSETEDEENSVYNENELNEGDSLDVPILDAATGKTYIDPDNFSNVLYAVHSSIISPGNFIEENEIKIRLKEYSDLMAERKTTHLENQQLVSFLELRYFDECSGTLAGDCKGKCKSWANHKNDVMPIACEVDQKWHDEFVDSLFSNEENRHKFSLEYKNFHYGPYLEGDKVQGTNLDVLKSQDHEVDISTMEIYIDMICLFEPKCRNIFAYKTARFVKRQKNTRKNPKPSGRLYMLCVEEFEKEYTMENVHLWSGNYMDFIKCFIEEEGGNHYFLLAIDHKQRKVWQMDPIANNLLDTLDLVNHLSKLTGLNYEFEKYNIASFKQFGSVDCALFLMKAAKSIAFDIPIEFVTQKRMIFFRKCAFFL